MKLLKGFLLAGLLTCACAITAGAAWTGAGEVNATDLRLRAEPNTSCTTLCYANKGEVVAILEEAEEGWYKVDYKTRIGYMSADFVKLYTSKDANFGYGIVNTAWDTLNLRSGVGTETAVLASIPKGAAVKVNGVVDGWLKVTYKETDGYVLSDFITLALDASGNRTDTPRPAATRTTTTTTTTVVTPVPASEALQAATSEAAARIIANAMPLQGKPYVYGAAGPNSFDCSGFTQYVARLSGFSIPRGASSQWQGITCGTYISDYNYLQAGDLVYICNPAYAHGYPVSHTLIYLGNNQVIHANSVKRVVMVQSFESYKQYFKGAWRLG